MIGEPSSWNVTQSTVTNSIPFEGVVAVVVVLFLVCMFVWGLWYAGSGLQRYKRIMAALTTVGNTIFYAIVGLIVVGALWLVYMMVDLLLKATGAVDPMAVVVAIAVFAILAVIGYGVMYLVNRVLKNAEAMRIENPKPEVTME
jgi:hypothetical protein